MSAIDITQFLPPLAQPAPAFECAQVLLRVHSYCRGLGHSCSVSQNLETFQDQGMAPPQDSLPFLEALHAD